MVASPGWDPPSASNAELPGDWARELDRHGVSMSVPMARVPGGESSVADAVGAFPHRFHGYFMLDPLADGARQRAERAFVGFGLRGLCHSPAMHRLSVQAERLAPLYECTRWRAGCRGVSCSCTRQS